MDKNLAADFFLPVVHKLLKNPELVATSMAGAPVMGVLINMAQFAWLLPFTGW